MTITFKNGTKLAMSMVLEKEVNTKRNINSEREEMVFCLLEKTFWKRINDIKGLG